LNVVGEFRITDGGDGLGTNFTYDPAGTLGFLTASTFNVTGTPAYWSTTASAPSKVNVQTGGISLSIPRTVNTLFQTSAPITNANNLTLPGTCQLDGSNALFTGTPTYGASSVLTYNTGGTFNAGAEFPATGAANVSVNSTTLLKLDGDKSISGTLSVGANTIGSNATTPFSLTAPTITLSTGTLNVNHLNVTGTLGASVTGIINLNGNWNVANFNAPTSVVNFNGAGAQSINTATSFNNATLNNDLNLAAGIVVNGTLALGSRKIATNANTVEIATTGSVTRTSGYVLGTIIKDFAATPSNFTFDVGTLNGYTPVNANATIGAGSLSVSATQSKHANVAGTNALARFWTLSGSGVTTNLTFNYLAGDVSVAAPLTEADYKVLKFSGGNFTQPAAQSVNAAAHTATVNGVSSFSDWTLAAPSSVFGEIQFAQANTNDAETNSGTHVVNIAVQRTGAASGAVSVDYSVTDGTAKTADNDYSITPATGTLNWTNNDSTDKHIVITVNGDTAFEPDETVNLSLSNAQGGATLGNPASATLTITNDDARPAPNTVYVDDDWTAVPDGTDPDGAGGAATEMGYDAFATIQSGVNGVATSGTVNVAAGAYTENVIVAKSLTLNGAGKASVTQRPATSNPNCDGAGGGSLCAGSSNLILIQADDVTITGLTLDGDNPALTSGIGRGGADVDARNGIITNHLVGTFTNLVVHHTTIKNIYLRGIYASSGGMFNFNHDTVQNVQGEGASIAMFNFGGAGVFDNNIVSDANDAISANHSRGVQFTNNHVTTSGSGVHTDNAGDGGGVADTIANNTVTDSTQFGFGVWVFVPSITVNVQNNTVTNVDVGFAAAGMAHGITGVSALASNFSAHSGVAQAGRRLPPSFNVSEPDSTFQLRPAEIHVAPLAPASPAAAIFTGNIADGQNKANSTGVYFTTDEFGFGSSDTRVTFESNTVKNNVDGFFLESEDTRTLNVSAAFNRVVNNSNSAVSVHDPSDPSPPGFHGVIDATMENNWWGCNAGPNNAGCGSIVGAGVDFNTWLVLSVSASPNPITSGGNSTVAADLTHNSENAQPSTTEFVPGTPVSFDATQGSVSPTSGTLSSGQAATTFTSTSASSGTASATVDNQTVSTPIAVNAPSFSIDDVFISEPQSGTSNATFTVTLSNPSQSSVSVHYATADGTAHAPDDYDSASGTLTFAPGETTKPVNVNVNADALAEGKETFAVNLSDPGTLASILDGAGQGTIVDPVLNGQVIISEFRFHGAGGAQDEFVELYNNTDRDITVATDDGTPGWALAAINPDGTSVDLLATIRAGAIIPARAHYLITDNPTVVTDLRARGGGGKVAVTAQGYSLAVEGDLTYDCDVDDGAGVALFRTAEPSSFNTDTRLDAAGFNDLVSPLADLFREGAGLTSPGAFDGEYSFVRNLTTGLPKDTNDNASDFLFVSTDGGVYGSVPSLLGAPGAENLASPIQRTTTVRASFIDPGCTGTSTTPGDSCARYRDTTADDANNSHSGTLAFRRKFTNNTSVNITRLRFRIVDITTRAGGASPAPGTADLRARTSHDNPSASTTGGGTVVIRGLTLDAPPAQLIGGYNSTLFTDTIKLDAPLAPGNSINVEFLVGVQQQGTFRFFITVEATLDAGTPEAFSKQGSVKATPPVKMKIK
jgi:hypothetical protein